MASQYEYFLIDWYLQTEGCSGAEITALCQEAALLTMQRDMQAPFVGSHAFGCIPRLCSDWLPTTGSIRGFHRSGELYEETDYARSARQIPKLERQE
jgi:SpoVK/Ycf46/Vps4 family AAA+-type ATPase